MVFNDKVQHVLIAQPGIRAVKELRGKRIAVSSLGSLDHNWLVELLPKFGLDPNRDVTFLVIGSTAERFVAMKAGSIDATLVSPPANFLAHEAGFPTLVRVADLIEDIVATIVTTNEKLTRQQGQVLRFLRATLKGFRIYVANPAEAVSTLMEFSRQPDRALMTRAYEHHMKTIPRDGTIPERLQWTLLSVPSVLCR